MNRGVAPLLLPKDQLANAINATVRGTFATHRPPYRKINLTYASEEVQTAFETLLWQCGARYKPDSGQESLLASIAGKLFEVIPDPNAYTATVDEVSTVATRQSATATQCWIWQSEKWAIWNDGLSNPVFFDGTTCVRSTYNSLVYFNTTTAGVMAQIPAIGTDAPALAFTSVASLAVGDLVTFRYRGTFRVQSIAGANVVLLNINAGPVGQEIPSGSSVSWAHMGTQLPPGRMGVYAMGRNWMSLVDGKQFVVSDIVRGSSGTSAEEYRDAVLQITENLYEAGGGNFTVPGSVGDIKAMQFVSVLDASMGQGPVQILTPNAVFSCNASVNRPEWQDQTNPILTVSLMANGGLSHYGTVMANGDMIFRAIDGIRSLILGRRDFNSWGNVPASREVEPILGRDDPALLMYSSAIVFDNRLLMTQQPTQHAQGVYHRGIVALNFDPLSSLRGKLPSVYDGLWVGLNVLQLIVGEFNGRERAFAFTLNTSENKIELYEILRQGAEFYDNGTNRIVSVIESPVIFGPTVNRNRDTIGLRDGEIYVDELRGTVDFRVEYKPDQWPCWIPWHSWSECNLEPTTDPVTARRKPGYRPAMGLGEPSADDCDAQNNRAMRDGHSFQVRITITGSCRFLGAKFLAITLPTPAFSQKVCTPICE